MAKEESKIKFSDRVKIEATAKARRLTAGKVYEMHPVAAKKLVDSGKAKYVKGAEKANA